MAGMCCGIKAKEAEQTSPVERVARTARRRRTELRQLKIISDISDTHTKRRKVEVLETSASPPPAVARECENASENCSLSMPEVTEISLEGDLPKLDAPQQPLAVARECENAREDCSLSTPAKVAMEDDLPKFDAPTPPLAVARECANACENYPLSSPEIATFAVEEELPKFGVTSVCGRRREMEDAVSIRPSFCGKNLENHGEFHFYGVFDGHGCSHVAKKCKERMHLIVKEQIDSKGEPEEWRETLAQSFTMMDKEVGDRSKNDDVSSSSSTSLCRCELQTPQCDAVGSTAVVAVVTSDKIVVSNCGDSRAVLCRNGVAIPLSSDHKPDRPDELNRIEAAGGRVIYWDGPRVLGMLAMSRAIGDNYLKPYVIPDPEVTVTDRSSDDECLILASDGLWDVVSNETAVAVARMCLGTNAEKPPSPPRSPGNDAVVASGSDKACSDASILLTKLALARHSADNVSVVVVDLRKVEL